MNKILNWIKANKLSAFLILVLVYFLGKGFFGNFLGVSSRMMTDYYGAGEGYGITDSASPMMGVTRSYNSAKSIGSSSIMPYEPAPQVSVTNRKVITNSQMSLLVLKVKDTIEKIQDEATLKGGYAVQTNVNTPEGTETGYIVVRVPSDKLKDFLKTLRSLSVRVVNENIQGTDITDSYVDSQARLDRLSATKAKVEEILNKATTVDEIIRVQQQIFSLQDQIDSIKGQLQYMDASSKTSLITIDLSTDELSLPYAPDKPWRPEVIVKQATRSLILTVRGLAGNVIWIGVYSVIWLPALIVVLVVRKMWKARHTKV